MTSIIESEPPRFFKTMAPEPPVDARLRSAGEESAAGAVPAAAGLQAVTPSSTSVRTIRSPS